MDREHVYDVGVVPGLRLLLTRRVLRLCRPLDEGSQAPAAGFAKHACPLDEPVEIGDRSCGAVPRRRKDGPCPGDTQEFL